MARPSRKALSALGQVALGHQHIAHLVIGDGEIALPSGVVGIGLGEALADGEARRE